MIAISNLMSEKNAEIIGRFLDVTCFLKVENFEILMLIKSDKYSYFFFLNKSVVQYQIQCIDPCTDVVY